MNPRSLLTSFVRAVACCAPAQWAHHAEGVLPAFGDAPTGITTTALMKRGTFDTETLEGLLDVMTRGAVQPGLVHGYDLRLLSVDELEKLVVVAAERQVSLNGCGIDALLWPDLVRRVEIRMAEEQRPQAHELFQRLSDLRAVVPCRAEMLVEFSHEALVAAKIKDVDFKAINTVSSADTDQDQVICTHDLQSCTAVAVITRQHDGSRLVTLMHTPDGIMAPNMACAVNERHQPEDNDLDHQVIVVTQGLDLGDGRWGIAKGSVRDAFELAHSTTADLATPCSATGVGPRWFAHSTTTLLVYPPTCRSVETAASFYIKVPADPSIPVSCALSWKD